MVTPVKYFHSAMQNAPALTGAAGSFIGVLSACLVNGFNSQSVTSASAVGGTTTLNFSSPHGFEVGSVIQVVGATGLSVAMNGEQRVATASTYELTFNNPAVVDGGASGSITACYAPAGWEAPFTGANLAAYRSQDPSGTRMFLRVDDTSATNVRVVGYETMSDVNTGTGPFPTNTQLSGGGWWPKASTTTPTNARAWTIVADSRVFYILMSSSHAATSGGVLHCFGDFASTKAGDSFACVLNCTNMDSSGSGSTVSTALEYFNSTLQTGAYLPRSYTAVGGAVAAVTGADTGGIGAGGVSGNVPTNLNPIYPNPSDNGLYLVHRVIVEPNVCRRGDYKGVYIAPQNCAASFSHRSIVAGQGETYGRNLIALRCGSPMGGTNGVLFIDITGPWF